MSRYLEIKWSISKAADSYGYNRVTLLDSTSGKKFAAVGGGYDMLGTVFGDWIEANYQPELLTLQCNAATIWNSASKKQTRSEKPNFYEHCDRPLSECKLYGMSFYLIENKISIDGSCGLDSMKQIAHCLGLEIEDIYSRATRNAKRIGFIVSKKGE